MAMPQRQKYKIQKYTKIQNTFWTKYELKFFTDAAWEIRQLIAYNYLSNVHTRTEHSVHLWDVIYRRAIAGMYYMGKVLQGFNI